MDYIDILMDDDDDTEEDSNSFSPSISSKNEAVLTRLDNLAQARKAAKLVALLRAMLQRGTLRLDSEMIPDFLADEIRRKQASELNAKAFNSWLDTLCIILADHSQEWLELNDIAIQCRTYRTLGTSQSSEAYQWARKKRSYYAKQLGKELTGSPYSVWFTMCEALLHSALDARFFESLAQAQVISERAYKGAKCKYHLDLSGQAKSDYKRVIHNTGSNSQAFDHLPIDAPVPVRMPPKIVRKLSKLKS